MSTNENPNIAPENGIKTTGNEENLGSQATDIRHEEDPRHPSRLSFFGRLACKFVPYKEVYETLSEIKERVIAQKNEIESLSADITRDTAEISRLATERNNLVEQLNSANQTNQGYQNVLNKICADLNARSLDDAVNMAASYSKNLAELVKFRKSSYESLTQAEYPILKEKYATLNDALLALAQFDQEASRPVQKVRSFDEIMRNPNVEERSMIWEFVNRELAPGHSTSSSRLNSIIEESKQVPELKTKLEQAQNRLNDTEAIAGEVLASTWSPAIAKIIGAKLLKGINASIEDESKKIPADVDFDNAIALIAESLSRPVDTEDAVRTGENKVLKAISDTLGITVDSIDAIAAKAENWHESRNSKEIFALFTAATQTDLASAESLAAACNAALSIKADVDSLLEKYGAESVGALPSAAVSDKFAKIKEEFIAENSDDEIRELVKDGSFNSLVKHLISIVESGKKQITAEQQHSAAARQETELANQAAAEAKNNLNTLTEDVIAAAAATVADHNVTLASRQPVEAVKEAASALEKVIAQRDNDIETLNETITERDSRIQKLDSDIKEKSAVIENFFNAYIAFVKDIFADMDNAVHTSFTGSNREGALPKAIDEKIITNDFLGLNEFKETLDDSLAKADHSSPEAVAEAIRESFVECLNIPSATWIDNLGRFFCYSRVPFIAEQFNAKKLDTARITTAFSLLQALLNRVGIKLLYPELFSDIYDPEEYDPEAIRNIDAYVSDITSHVDDDETVIDLYTLGYSLNGKVVSKPIVSRINN